jgi:hypothetical protein
MSDIPIFQQNVFGITSIAGTSPAAGAGYQYFIPDHYLMELLSLIFTYTADANVANRNIQLTLIVDSIYTSFFRDPVSITAGQTYSVAAFPSAPSIHPLLSTGTILIPIPRGLVMRSGDSIFIDPTLMQVGDTLTDIRFTTRSWFIL